MTHRKLTDPELDQHLRRTLQAIAATVDEQTPAASRSRRCRARPVIVGLAAVAVAVPLAAAAVVGLGPEYVDTMPPDDVVVAGDVDGRRYWLVQSFHTDACGLPVPGVELVLEESNLIGREWNTAGISYGEPRAPGSGGRTEGCGYDVSAAMRNPAVSYSGGIFSGDTFLQMYAVHPDVSAVRVTIGGSSQVVAVHPVDGAGYAVFEVPPDAATYTVELLVDGTVVPGSTTTRDVPDRGGPR